MTPETQPARVALGAAAAVLLIAGIAVAAVIVHFTNGSSSVPASAVPGITETPAPGPCLDTAGARRVWTDVSKRLDALALQPDVARVSGVAEGSAADQLRTYLQQTLIDKQLHEREQERLDGISVVQAGCNGQPLTVRATETLVQDDYLAADGHVDHVDKGVGQTTHLLESYVRSGSTWKVIDITSLDLPTPSPSGNFV